MNSRNLCRIPFQPFFVERVFHIFDKDDNGSISLQEFIDAMHQFAGQSPDDKIKFLFKVYDIDGKKERQTARFAVAAAVKTSSIVRPVPRPQIGLIYPRRRNPNRALQAGRSNCAFGPTEEREIMDVFFVVCPFSNILITTSTYKAQVYKKPGPDHATST